MTIKLTKNLKRLALFTAAATVCFGLGLGLAFFVQSAEPVQEIIQADQETQAIENTAFYPTLYEDINSALSVITQERLDSLISEDTLENPDIVSLEQLGEEIQAIMTEITGIVNNFYLDYNFDDMEIDDTYSYLEDYYRHFINLRELRGIDRDISYILYLNGVDYEQFYSHSPELEEKDGKFSVVYEEPENPALLKYYYALKKSRIFETITDIINARFYFERNHTIEFIQGNAVNAYYDPATQNISIHYELFDEFYTALLSDTIEASSDAGGQIIDTAIYTLIHELGHAFIDIYNIPFIGKEEDVADHLAIVLAIEIIGLDSPDLAKALMPAPLFDIHFLEEMAKTNEDFDENIKELSDEDLAEYERLFYADTHSLNSQRVIDAMTLIYGVKPFEADFLVASNKPGKYRLTQDTINNALDIYLDTSNFWYNALYPYMR